MEEVVEEVADETLDEPRRCILEGATEETGVKAFWIAYRTCGYAVVRMCRYAGMRLGDIR